MRKGHTKELANHHTVQQCNLLNVSGCELALSHHKTTENLQQNPIFWRSALALQEVELCLSPTDMLTAIMHAVRVMHAEAKMLCEQQRRRHGKGYKGLNADELFPVMLYTLVQAKLWRPHACLHFLDQAFGSQSGEEGYYLTSLQAMVTHIRKIRPDERGEQQAEVPQQELSVTIGAQQATVNSQKQQRHRQCSKNATEGRGPKSTETTESPAYHPSLLSALVLCTSHCG